MPKRKKGLVNYIGFVATTAIFVVVITIAVSASASARKATAAHGLDFELQSIQRSLVECYALEGAYPPDLAYLEENYGLTADRENYVVYYYYNGQNILPDFDVIERAGS
ncbi:MAG: hypothetical protein RSE36_05640 [Oscillospiraceae bacterium]